MPGPYPLTPVSCSSFSALYSLAPVDDIIPAMKPEVRLQADATAATSAAQVLGLLYACATA